jgi:hypothetical protein
MRYPPPSPPRKQTTRRRASGRDHERLRLSAVRGAAQVEEALRRAKFKFPGRQKVITSRKWGFTGHDRADYVNWKKEGRLVDDGSNAKVRLASPAPALLPPPLCACVRPWSMRGD